MSKKIIWSTHEEYLFVDILKKDLGIEKELSDEEVEILLYKHKSANLTFLKEHILKQFDKCSEKDILGFATVYSVSGSRGQKVEVLGKNSKAIFGIPFDKATWYVDTWNIRADIEYKGVKYFYTFRTIIKEDKQVDVIEKINKGRPMLTSTYLGHHTKSILNKRR